MYSGLYVSCESHSGLCNRIESIRYKNPHLSDLSWKQRLSEVVSVCSFKSPLKRQQGHGKWDLHFRAGTNIGYRYDELQNIYIWRTMRSWAQSSFPTVKSRVSGIHISGSHLKKLPVGGKNVTRILINSPHPQMSWPYPKGNLWMTSKKNHTWCSSNSGSANLMYHITEYALQVNLILWRKLFSTITFRPFIKK